MGIRILLVDDQLNQRKSLAIFLRLDGHHVIEAGDGCEALEVLEAHHGAVDVALVDVMMPRMNGLDLARQLAFRFPAVPVVLASAYHLSARQVAQTAGQVVGFAPKPYDPEELSVFLVEKAAPLAVDAAN